MAELNLRCPFTGDAYTVTVQGTMCGNRECAEYDVIFYDDDYGQERGFNGCDRGTPCSEHCIKE